jgi:hypothetical protein
MITSDNDYLKMAEDILQNENEDEEEIQLTDEDLVRLAHGGGLDRFGGHTDKSTGEYHVHKYNGKKLKKPIRYNRRTKQYEREITEDDYALTAQEWKKKKSLKENLEAKKEREANTTTTTTPVKKELSNREKRELLKRYREMLKQKQSKVK